MRESKSGRRAPLSHSQEGHFFLGQLAGGRLERDKNVFAVYRVKAIETEVIEQALSLIAYRHDVFRTRILLGSACEQVLTDEPNFPLIRQKASGESPEDLQSDLFAIIGREITHDFDPSTGTMSRGCLIDALSVGTYLVVTLDHYIADPYSMILFTRELSAVCTALRAGTRPRLPALDTQYIDYSDWQRSLAPSQLSKNISYWLSVFADTPQLSVPFAQPSAMGIDRGVIGCVERIVIPGASKVMRKLRRTAGVTPYSCVMAALLHAFFQMGATPRITVATFGAHRPRKDTANLIGNFGSICFVQVDASDAPTFAELAQRIQASTLAGLNHSMIGFADIIAIPESQTVLNRALYPWTVLHYFDSIQGDDSSGLEAVRLQELDPMDTNNQQGVNVGPIDLHMVAEQAADSLEGELRYNSRLFEKSAIQTLIDLVGRQLSLAETGRE